ncbi:hypothetical protein J6590_103728, partial [Homalodisca vitripennis]
EVCACAGCRHTCARSAAWRPAQELQWSALTGHYGQRMINCWKSWLGSGKTLMDNMKGSADSPARFMDCL